MESTVLIDVEEVLRARGWSWRRLRDFAAYVEVTGAFPTPLRVASYDALRSICDVYPSALAPLSMQVWNVTAPFAEALKLGRHPMVIMAANLKARGSVSLSRTCEDRFRGRRWNVMVGSFGFSRTDTF